MSKNQATNETIKAFILKTAKEQRPETTSQLIGLIHTKTNLPEKKIMVLLSELETEGKIHLNFKQDLKSLSFGNFLFRSDLGWYWAIMAVAVITIIVVFTVSQDWQPIAFVRNILGVIFVLFLPGYAFEKALFPMKVPIKTSSESLDNIERVVLSVGMSIALTSLIGITLYFTPLGIGLIPITLSLLFFTLGFATVALIREYQTKLTTIP